MLKSISNKSGRYTKSGFLDTASLAAAALAGTVALGTVQAHAASTVTSFQGFNNTVQSGFWQGSTLTREQAPDGSWHAEIARNAGGGGGYTYFGDPESTHTGSVVQSLDIYVDTNWAHASGTDSLFKLNMTPYKADGTGQVSQAGEQFLFSFNTNGSINIEANGLGGYGQSITDINTSGWYTFTQTFRKGTDGYIKTDLSVYDANGNLLGTQTRGAGPGQPGWSSGKGGENNTLGGHDYVWVSNWADGAAGNLLKIDNAAVSILFDDANDITLTNTIDGSGSTIKKGTGKLTMDGVYDSGALLVKGGQVDLSNGAITTTRNNYFGLLVTNGAQANVQNTSITAMSDNSSGFYLENSATLNYSDGEVKSSGPTIHSVFNVAGQTQDINFGAGSILTDNNGTLLQVNRTISGLDGIVNLTLSGAGTTAQGDITDTDGLVNGLRSGGGVTNLTVENGASWVGKFTGEGRIKVNGNGTAATFADSSEINSTDVYPTLISVTSGGQLDVSDGTKITNTLTSSFTNSLADGKVLYVSGNGSKATLNNVTLILDNDSRTGADTSTINVTLGGEVDINQGSVIKTTGSIAAVAIAPGNGGILNITGTQNGHVTVSGNGMGINLWNGVAGATTKADLSYTDINMTNWGIGVTSDSSLVSGLSSGQYLNELTADHITVTTTGAGYGVGIKHGSKGTLTDSSITTNADDSAGLIVLDHSVANLTDTSITTSGNSSIGASIDGSGSSLTMNGGSITTSGIGAAGLYVTDGSTATLGLDGSGTGVVINTSGDSQGANYADGVFVNGASTFSMTGGSIKATGKAAAGLYISDSGSLATLNGVEVSTEGNSDITNADYAAGIFVDHASNLTMNGGGITTSGKGAAGLYVTDGSSATLGVDSNGQGVIINASGDSFTTNPGYANGITVNNDSTLTMTGGSITVTGEVAAGMYIAGSNSAVTFNDVNISTQGSSVALQQDSTAGIFADSGSDLTMNGGSITTTGANAYGLYVKDGATATLGLGSDNQGVNIHTSGAGAYGIAVTGGGSSYTMTGGSIVADNAPAVFVDPGGSVNISGGTNISSGSGAAVVVQDDGSVTLGDSTYNSPNGPTILSTFTQTGQTQNITIGSGVTTTNNNGTLLKVDRGTNGADANVSLTLAAGSNTNGNIDDPDGVASGKLDFTVDPGATWGGLVYTNNDDQVSDGSSSDVSNTTGNVRAGNNTTLTGTNSNIGGGVQTGSGTRASFGGTTNIKGNLKTGGSGAGSTFTFSGPTTIGNVNNLGSSGNITGTNTIFSFGDGDSTNIIGNLELQNGSSFHGGTIDNPIHIGGNVIVDNSFLGGNIFADGSLGGNGTLAPGNSVGVQSFNTSAGFTGDYQAEVNAAGQSDLIEIRNGDFDISGINLTVDQEYKNGSYQGFVVDHQYTIVQTDNGQVKNQFASNTLGSSFDGTLVTLDPVIYNLNNVQISLSIKSNPDRSGYTANQNAALDGVLSAAPSGNPTANAILMIPGTEARGDALNQVSGEVYASTQSIMLTDGNMISRMLTQRMWSNLGAGVLPGGEPVAQASYYQYLPKQAMPVHASLESKTSSDFPLWIQAVGNWYDLDSDGNAAETKAHNAGVFIGGDTKIFDDWHIGAAFGFTSGRVDVDSRNSSSDLDNYTASVYGGHSWALSSEENSSSINLMFGGAYTYHYIDSKRDVYVPGYQSLEAKYNAGTTQAFGQIGYEIPVGELASFEPYAGINWLGLRTASFQETGGSAALSSSTENNNVTMFTLGLHGSSDFKIGPVNGSVYAGAGWRHSEGDLTPNSNVALAGGSSFLVSGVPVARDAAIVSGGLEADLADNIALGFGYDGQFGGDNMSNGGQVYLRITF